MENSVGTSENTAITTTTSQESSWTKYFEYFMASEEKRRGGGEANSSSSLSSYSNPSHDHHDDDVAGNSSLSDAASLAGSKPLVGMNGASSGCKTVKVKRRKLWGFSDEDPLEDTASSPVNSPKVSDLMQLELSPPNQPSPPKRDHISTIFKGNEIIPAKQVNTDNNIKEVTELKKRGLCLVPASMLMDNYRSEPMRTRNISEINDVACSHWLGS